MCVATNSHPDRVRHSLEVTGLWSFFEPHVFSAFPLLNLADDGYGGR